MTPILLAIVAGYGILILLLTRGFKGLAPFEPEGTSACNSFSVIVVFRNEIENLTRLMDNFSSLDYPSGKFEILLIDDDSEDGSLDMIKKFQANSAQLDIRILENHSKSKSPKKEAIEKGVQTAKYDWIITTDADCSFERDFLIAYDQYLQKNKVKFVAGPVTCRADDSFLQRFQQLDFISLQGSAMGGFGAHSTLSWIRPFMCNGANLCYERDSFRKINAYEGNRHIASGDDVFLLEKMLLNHREEVHFIKSKAARVTTLPKNSWKELLEQRKRWASKTASYKNNFGKGVGILVLLTNLGLVAGLGLCLSGQLQWSVLGVLFAIKINADFLLIYAVASFFDQKDALKSFVPSSFLYPFFITVVTALSVSGSYEWKGRSFRK